MTEPAAGADPGEAGALGPVDALIWDEAPRAARTIAIIDAPALVGPALTITDDVRVWCDDWRDAQQIDPARRVDPAGLAGADLVLARLPKSLDALDEQAASVQGSESVTYLGGGRIKHLNRSMNQTLARHFSSVTASLGRQKSRVLRATEPLGTSSRWPEHRRHPALDVVLAAHGATFAGTRLDDGTALLLAHLDRLEPRAPSAAEVLDVGSGNGVIATVLARRGHRVSACDVSWSAVAATAATAAANGVSVDVSWGDGLAGLPEDAFDVIVTNPPFHRGFAKESADTLALFTDARRVLRSGGELWCVFNSHLPWRRELEARLGHTMVIAQDRHYTLTATTAR